MTNRLRAANDAVWELVQAAFAGAAPAPVFHRNPDGDKAWAKNTVAVVQHDDKTPETLRVLCGPAYDLKITPRVLLARRRGPDERASMEWDDVETLKAAVDADRTLGGVVEHVRLGPPEPADLDEAQWLGGGLEIPLTVLFSAPTEAG